MADSPLSDADSLSSAGASTEPLPGSDPAPISPVKRTLGPSRRNTGGRGGNESDSSLTEQDSSDNEQDRDEDELEDRLPRGSNADGRGRAGSSIDDEGDDDDEDLQPTPRAKPRQKRRAIDDDEEEHDNDNDDDDELDGPDDDARLPRDGDGRVGTDDEVDELSEGSGDEGRLGVATGQPPTKRLRRGGGPSLNGSIVSSSTANGRLSRAGSPTNSLSDPEDDLVAVVKTALVKDDEPEAQREGGFEEDGLLDELTAAAHPDASGLLKMRRPSGGRGKSRGGATSSKPRTGGRGAAVQKARATGGGGGSSNSSSSRGPANSHPTTRDRSLSPSARSDSPLSIVSSSDGAAAFLRAAADEEVHRNGAAADDDDDDDAAEVDVDGSQDESDPKSLARGKPGKPALDYATGRSARGRGRGRARYRPPRKPRGGGGLSAPSISRSDSNDSSSGADTHEYPLVNGNSTEAHADLPEPSGLVELDTSEPARLADQLDKLAEAEARPTDLLPTNGDAAVQAQASEPKADGPRRGDEEDEVLPAMDLMQEEEERHQVDEKVEDRVELKEKPVAKPAEKAKKGEKEIEKEKEKEREKEKEKEKEKEERREPIKRVAPASAKKGGKKGGKRGKGKEKAVDQDALVPEDDEFANDSDHEEDTSDAAFMRKRGEAMEHLTKIEIQFAKLRDLLYVERMTEVEKDRIAIETGSHPELIHLTQLLELRRNKRLELAKAWLDGLELSYDRQYFSDEHAMWNQWQNKRAELRTEMLEEANTKRRRLDREKRALERPKDDTLATILAPRASPAVPLHHRRRLGFDGEPLVENEIAWALRNPDVRADPSLSALDDADAYADLERMGLRESIGHHGLYPYDSIYGHGAAPHPAYADPRAAHLGPGFPYSYDPAAIAMQSHSYVAAAAAAAATPAPFASLPPLPGRDQPPSRPSSNPRHANYPGDSGSAQQQHAYSAASNRIYPYSNYPESVTAESMHAGQHGSWPGKPSLSSAYGFEEERRRTLSAGGTLGTTESLDSIAGSRQSGGGPNGHDDVMNGSRAVETGGRTTPVGGSNPKPRLTLDDHMSHRSPKATTSTTKTAERTTSGRNSPASFMAIPTIPPFDRHRHEMAIAAARANSPHPSHAKPAQSASSVYPHSSATDQQAQYPHQAATGQSAAQRAGYM